MTNLIKVTGRKGEIIAYEYDALIRPVAVHLPDGISTYKAYNARNQVTEQTTMCDDCGRILSHYLYTYGNRGYLIAGATEMDPYGRQPHNPYKPEKQGENCDHGRNKTLSYYLLEMERSYTYDDAGKLLYATETQKGCGTTSWRYAYDLMGNRILEEKKGIAWDFIQLAGSAAWNQVRPTAQAIISFDKGVAGSLVKAFLDKPLVSLMPAATVGEHLRNVFRGRTLLDPMQDKSQTLGNEWSPTRALKDRMSRNEAKVQALAGNVENVNAYYIGRCTGDVVVYAAGLLEVLGGIFTAGSGGSALVAEAASVIGLAAAPVTIIAIAGGAAIAIDGGAMALHGVDMIREDMGRYQESKKNEADNKSSRRTVNGFDTTINAEKQGKHIVGNNNYIEGRSIFKGTVDDAQRLVDNFAGTGEWIGTNKERVNFGEVIGQYINPVTNEAIDTTVGIIHYSKTGTHIVPAQPIQ